LEQPFDGELDGSTGSSSEITRRKFLKRTGGATAASVIVTHFNIRHAIANVPEVDVFPSMPAGHIVIKICISIRPNSDVEVPQQEPLEGWDEWFDSLLRKDSPLDSIEADLIRIQTAYDDGGWKDAPPGTFEASKAGGQPPTVMIGNHEFYTANAKVCHIRKVRK
jgi:hypothetical protein